MTSGLRQTKDAFMFIPFDRSLIATARLDQISSAVQVTPQQPFSDCIGGHFTVP